MTSKALNTVRYAGSSSTFVMPEFSVDELLSMRGAVDAYKEAVSEVCVPQGYMRAVPV